MRRSVLLKLSVAVVLVTGMAAVPMDAARAQATPLPYDEARGVFSFAEGLERTLPAVVQVTTLGQSSGPRSEDTEAQPAHEGPARLDRIRCDHRRRSGHHRHQ